MLTISTWHPPSAVSHSVKCNLTSNDVPSLVVAKINKLEVYDLTPSGLDLRCSFDTWGTVTSLLTTQRKGRALSSLIVTTDHLDPKLYVLDFDSHKSQLTVSRNLSLRLRAGREAEFWSGAIIHPNGKVVVCCQYSGMIKVVVLGDDQNVVFKEFDCRIPELNVHDLCFVPVAGSKLILGILSEDYHLRKHVVARELKLDEEELLYEHSTAVAGGFAQDDATHLIPVSGPRKTAGILAVGGGSCHFFGSERVTSKRASTGDKLTAVHSLAHTDIPLGADVAHAQIDEDRFILADRHGLLCILGLTRSGPGGTVSSISVAELGQVSSPATITHISGHIIYIGSSRGDSQTIRLLQEPKSDGSHIEVLESYSNIGAIVDAVLAEVDNSGQREVVTCSGGGTTGSLRAIRSGAEFRQSVVLDAFPNVENVFPIRKSYDDMVDELILMTTPFATTVLELNKSSMDEVEHTAFPGFARTERTLFACTIMYKRSAVQVTTSRVLIIDMITGVEDMRWPATGTVDITAATANATQICIALQGGKILYFDMREGQKGLFNPREKAPEMEDGLPKEVASLSIEPYLPSSKKTSFVIAVGYWIKNTVAFYNVPSLLPYKGASFVVHEPHVPRSILLHDFGTLGDTRPHLIVGLGDGAVVTYYIAKDGLKGRRTINIGPEQAVSFARCAYKEAESDRVVLVAGARGAVIWYDKKTKRLRNSAVSIKDVTAVCALNHPFYPGSVLLASNVSAMIGRLGELNKLNIRTIPFGLDNPKLIAYSPQQHAYVVGCQRDDISVRSGTAKVTNFLKIVDATTFESKTRIDCEVEEDLTCMNTLELKSPHGVTKLVVVGTASIPPPGSIESQNGRILVLDGEESSKIKVVTSASVAGCVYSVACINGMIAAAVNSYIYVFNMEQDNDKSPLRLIQKAKWDKGFIITALSSHGDVLVAADALKSITILKLRNNELQSLAQHYDSIWPFSVGASSDNTALVGEMDHNISLFKREGDVIERIGGIHYNELINKFIPGSIALAAPNAPIQPKMVVVTPSGRIGIISDVQEAVSIRLTELQRNLGYVIRGPGDVELSHWRTPKMSNKTSPFAGFIDGDFVEGFLNLSEEQIQQVMEGRNEFERLAGTKDDMIELVEQIASMH